MKMTGNWLGYIRDVGLIHNNLKDEMKDQYVLEPFGLTTKGYHKAIGSQRCARLLQILTRNYCRDHDLPLNPTSNQGFVPEKITLANLIPLVVSVWDENPRSHPRPGSPPRPSFHSLRGAGAWPRRPSISTKPRVSSS